MQAHHTHTNELVAMPALHDTRKRFETARAIAARRGYELREIVNVGKATTYLLSRWGLCREAADLDAVDLLLGRIEG